VYKGNMDVKLPLESRLEHWLFSLWCWRSW